MAPFGINFSKPVKINTSPRTYIAVPSHIKAQAAMRKMEEASQGKVVRNEQKFPTDLGEKHPFDFSQCETFYLSIPLIEGAVDKLVDHVWAGGYHTKSDNPKAKKLIDDWNKAVNWDLVGRQWLKEALMKGNGFLELGGGKKDVISSVKVLNANYMFLRRKDTGEVLGYSQYVGDPFKGFKLNEVTPFDTFQIAHLSINIVGDCPYGYGIIHPLRRTLNYLLSSEKNMHKLLERKANNPFIFRVGKGDDGIHPQPADMQALANDLVYMDSGTEWVVSSDVEPMVLDTGNFSEKFESTNKGDIDHLFAGLQVPEVLMGRGSIPEGLATVQLEDFKSGRIKSIQTEVENQIEQKIYKRLLLANGIDATVEFEWGTPSDAEIATKLTLYGGLIGNPFLSDIFKKELEVKMALLVGIAEEKIKQIEKDPLNEPQPQLPGSNRESQGELVKSDADTSKVRKL